MDHISDSLRVQVAAVVAQQAALTEREIRLDAAREEFVREQRGLLDDIESLLLHILAQEEHLDRRLAEVRNREAFAVRLERASARLARELEMVQLTLSSEDDLAHPAACRAA